MKKTTTSSIILSLFTVILLAGCTSNQQMPGSDKDAHGCIGSAGYSWCEAKQKCLRVWEEPCTLEDTAKTFCGKQNVAKVYTCGEYVKVVSSLIGGGSTFYKIDQVPIVCPVVAPDSMTEQCRQLLLGNNCVEKEIC